MPVGAVAVYTEVDDEHGVALPVITGVAGILLVITSDLAALLPHAFIDFTFSVAVVKALPKLTTTRVSLTPGPLG